MKALWFLLFIPIFSNAQEQIDNKLEPFIGHWSNSTKNYSTKVEITHESAFPLNKLTGISTDTTEVLFFDFYYYDKEKKSEVIINSSLEENPRSFTAFLSDDHMPNVLIIYGDQGYKYKLKTIDENRIELFSNEKPRYVVDFATKESRVIPKEPSPIPDRIVLKRVKK